MKILVITQKVDFNDPVLGFFVEWLNVFSKYFEKVITICLEKGSDNLSGRVSIHSLGKEKGRSRLKYIINFFSIIIRERKSYDAVFVHMNQEYVILGALIWKILGKRILFWRNHKSGTLLTRLAVYLSDTVYYTSPQSYTARFKNAKQMPVGISVPDSLPIIAKPKTVLSLGRISSVKKIDLIIDVLKSLDQRKADFVANIVGDPINKKDFEYEKKIKNNAKSLILKGKINFSPGVPHLEIKDIFAKNRFFINITPDGSLDKTIFEAMANGSIPITSNGFFKGVVDDRCFLENLDLRHIVEKVEHLLNLDDELISKWRINNWKFSKRSHGVDLVVKSIYDDCCFF